jgi:hypothetical protein
VQERALVLGVEVGEGGWEDGGNEGVLSVAHGIGGRAVEGPGDSAGSRFVLGVREGEDIVQARGLGGRRHKRGERGGHCAHGVHPFGWEDDGFRYRHVVEGAQVDVVLQVELFVDEDAVVVGGNALA